VIRVNQRVVISLASSQLDNDLKAKLEVQDKLVLDVVDKTGLGVCTLLLPEDVSIKGHSRQFDSGEYKGREYLRLHESQLKAV